MDSSITKIADFASKLSYEDLPPEVVHQCTRLIVDTLCCGIAAFNAEPSKIARKLAMRVSVDGGAQVLGTTHRTLPELAAFANSVMCRFIEGNDTFPGGGGHPSDAITGILAVAQANRCDIKSTILGMVVCYDIIYNMFHAVCMRDHNFDHVCYTVVGCAAGAAKALGLDREQIANAVGLALNPNLALHATRSNTLSMWKGCAGGNAARNGVFAALLAKEGMTGPLECFEGVDSLQEVVGKFELAPFAPPYKITQVSMKCVLTEYHAQAPILTSLKLHKQVNADDIEAVTIHTYWFCWSEIGSDPEKWHPTTREEADHSLPFMIAAVLIYGQYGEHTFTPERLRDQKIHQLADKIKIIEDAEFSKRFPKVIPCKIEVKLKGGKVITETLDSLPGHISNPMTDEQLSDKFRNLAGYTLPKERVERALEVLWKFDETPDLDAIFKVLLVDEKK
jgi:2-methylcitrate dehydratase